MLDIDKLTVFAGGAVAGSGTIATQGFVNFGDLSPGDSSGEMIINGNYRQKGAVFGSQSGSLLIEIASEAGPPSDQLTVLGEATLGGGLIVEFTGPPPKNPDSLPAVAVLAAQSIKSGSNFDVALMPGLPPG